MTAYATRDDVFRYGLPPAVLVAPPRSLEAVDVVSNRFTLSGHGLNSGDTLEFRVTGGSLTTPLSASSVYWAKPVPGSDNLFEVSLSQDGASVDLSALGTGLHSIVVSYGPRLDKVLEQRSRYVDDHLIAHGVPLSTPIPLSVVAYVATLAAADMMRIAGLANPNYRESAAIFFEAANAVEKKLTAHASGVPLRGVVVDATPDEPDAGALGWGDDPRGWQQTDESGSSFL